MQYEFDKKEVMRTTSAWLESSFNPFKIIISEKKDADVSFTSWPKM